MTAKPSNDSSPSLKTNSDFSLGTDTPKSKTKEYMVWKQMKRRCSQPSDVGWKYYGGRGIKVCDRWQTFENFIEDMGWRPSPNHSLDRIDPNGNYEPGNVRWATPVVQGSNKRNSTPWLKIRARTKEELQQWYIHGRIDPAPLRGLDVARMVKGWAS